MDILKLLGRKPKVDDIQKEPIYCSTCGKELAKSEWPIAFNPYTGEPTSYTVVLKCPEFNNLEGAFVPHYRKVWLKNVQEHA